MLTHSYHWLVTGGAGFIGSHIVKELVQQGQKVTVLDNLSGGKLDNLSPVQDKITFIQGDICDFDTVKKACQGVNYVLHLAALISVAESMAKPQETAEINVQGTVNVLEAARQCGAKRVVFSSSAAVYGTRPELPYKEDTPIDC
jgi:UDP-glucose 4-epimerase